MIIATWNVNSLNVRMPQVLAWLAEWRPAILGLQELKQTTEAVDVEAIRSLGYEALVNGQKTYNGVALIYDAALGAPTDVVTDIPDFDDPQRRVIAATFGSIRVINVYVVNGEAINSDKFAYKLRWLAALHAWIKQERAEYDQLVLMGDFNIAPTDADVYDPESFRGQVLCTETERGHFNELLSLGLTDALRYIEPTEPNYTWWDYRAAGFRRDRGLRIDHVLISEGLRSRLLHAEVDRVARGWERPSDHAPVRITLGAD
ncbi:exodeoxyribonuclease III [Halothiobacillus diazotrophicus]|uniref:Exodeoxyribonuclease III n=1 Tax=Halothiobacillus diazotrophicus TaxID=1860122 RepID=A0A191ZI15_9GAMM|nr:exodeoxyribonuclease III [Halothiobacillus diazotrophicus]ANJ67519.1 exodeoxyribonuclease III [Halothiobacillus diazotrophicus]